LLKPWLAANGCSIGKSKGRLEAPIMMILKDRPAEHDLLSCWANKHVKRLFEVQKMEVMDRIKEQVESNPIVIYMKGTPQFPMCGFSSRAAAALQDCGVPFAYVNVLADPEIFENLPRFADWPTFPQIYIDGELIGGCDITLEMHQSGELKNMMEEAAAKATPAGES
jgi:monothiol glutaredoxin